MSLATEPLRALPPTSPVRRSGDPTTRGRIAGLDGLRAIAVIAVIAYHYLPGTAPGGFLGVDLFFVISGFLITTLLLAERTGTGRIALAAFWQRRARRLLPALVAMLLVTSAAALAIGGDLLAGIGRQLTGAATFSYNWLAIAAGNDYFQSAAPELYRNLWSLSVEEQFYLLWPLVVMALFVIPSRRARFWIVAGMAVASATAMITLTLTGADATRLYFGSDSHSLGLLLGACAALAANPLPAPSSRLSAIGSAIVRWTFLVPLIGLAIVAFARFDDSSALRTSLSVLLFSGLAAAIVIAVVRLPSAGRVLDTPPLRWVGERSYGLYLWHWPVLVLLIAVWHPDTGNVGAMVGIAAVALALTVAASVLSYRWIETPVRQRGFRGSAVGLGEVLRRGSGRSRAVITIAPVLAVALAAAMVTAVLAEPVESLASERIRGGQAVQAAAERAAAQAIARDAEKPAAPRARSVALPPRPTGEHVTVIGDSVTLASLPELQSALPGLLPDAQVSRQMSAAPNLLQALKDAGGLREYVVVALGTNGGFGPEVLDSVRAVIGPERKLVLVTAFADRGWTPGVNQTLVGYAQNDPQTAIADWSSAIAGHTNLLAGDNVHPGAAGGRIFAATVVDALDSLYTIPPELVDRLIPSDVPGTELVLR